MGNKKFSELYCFDLIINNKKKIGGSNFGFDNNWGNYARIKIMKKAVLR